jgi:cell division septum initiation protein DivIVA
MTKNEEIQLLLEASIKLGSNSYCGDWLKEQIPFIEHDMRCDIIPNSSWSDTRRLHDGMIETANQQSEYLIKAAKEKADKIVQDAEKQADNLRKWVQRDIQKALDAII